MNIHISEHVFKVSATDIHTWSQMVRPLVSHKHQCHESLFRTRK